MSSIVRFERKKFTATQTLQLVGVDEFVARQKRKTFSIFQSSDDPDPVPFRIRLMFGEDEEKWLSCFLQNRSSRSVFIYETKFSLSDSKSRNIRTLKFQKHLLNTFPEVDWGFEKFYSLKDKCVNKSEEVDYIFTCEVTYGGSQTEENFVAKSPTQDSTLPVDMIDLFESKMGADVTFNLGEGSLKAHKNILTARSLYFRHMFESQMQEAKTNEIDVPDVHIDVFKEFLKFIYSGVIPDNIEKLGLPLLPLADRYDVKALKEMCELTLVNSISVVNVVEITILAYLHNCATLTKSCFVWIKKNFQRINETEEWKEMKKYPDLLMGILGFSLGNVE